MRPLRWLTLRLGAGLLGVLSISLLVFLAIRLLPSDPARVILGPGAPASSVQALRHQLGMDRPLASQYLGWLGSALRGDFGQSLDSHVAVVPLLAERLGASLALLGAFALPALLLALALGSLLALRQGGRLDRLCLPLLALFKSLPVFVVAVLLIMLLATSVFTWLPAMSLLDSERSPWAQPRYLALPALTLLLSAAPYLVRLQRAAMIEAWNSDYLDAARLRGIAPWRLLLRHALPNALLPLVQGMALVLSVFFSSVLLVEIAFNYPGLGNLLNDALRRRDVPLIQAGISLVAAFVVLVNLLADALTVLLTPRLRTAG
ncbi:ABC transporter permease [Pseudomonas oryziphila]|uniref:ABC transporter permease n=1 Tax=Pseudomonas entomophila TaxID=312306 RepID=A0A3Q8U1D7_9PSED|nr:ABC transporter permease [Pseudomonas oryziphila]AZL68388.1 ABC transporter permease [Pseudomonas oryziphila]